MRSDQVESLFGPGAPSMSPAPNTQFLFRTPFEFYVGPNQDKAMCHRELLCAKSPYIAKICAEGVNHNARHAKLQEIHHKLQVACEGPNANISEGMIGAIRNALQAIDDSHRIPLRDCIQESMVKNCKSKAVGALTPEKSVSYVDWLCPKLQLAQPPQIANVCKSAKAFVLRSICGEIKSVDPVQSAAMNKLYLPNSSIEAVEIIVGCLYNSCLPNFETFHRDTLITLCHLNSTARQLGLFEISNHCMDVLASKHILLIEPVTAKTIIGLMQQPENPFWNRIRLLMLDILSATDHPELNDEQVSDILSLMPHLAALSSTYIAQKTAKRTRALLKRINEHQCGSPTSIKPEEAVKREDSTVPEEMGFVAPFSTKFGVCRKYHWHPPGEGCFPETRREPKENNNNGSTPAPSVISSVAVPRTVEKVAGQKRKAADQDDEDNDEEDEDGDEDDREE